LSTTILPRRPLADRTGLLLAGLIVMLLLWRIPYYGKIVLDDAFITFRYADNLIRHGQFVFNLGEPVLATTTPLYGFLLAGIGAASVPIPLGATIINLLFECGSLYLIVQLLRRLGLGGFRLWTGGAVAGLLLISNRSFSIASNSGMETALFVFLHLGVMLFIIDRKYRAAAVLGAIAALTRPDGIFILLTLGITVLVMERRIPVIEIGIALLIGAPWVVIAQVTYGSFLPQSIVAKDAVELLWNVGLIDKLRMLFLDPLRIFSIFLLPPVVAAVVTFRIRDRRRALFPLFLFGAMYALYLMLPNNLGFDWYFPPLFAVLFILTGYGALQLAHSRWLTVLVGAGLGIGIVYSSVGNFASVATIDRIWRDGIFNAITYLNSEASQEAVVQINSIGYVGYMTDFRILDPLGLVSPEVIPLMDDVSSLEALYVQTASEFAPDYVISFGRFDYAGYRIVAEYSTSDTPVVVYARG
jgi:arabinofuranosyltransferase